jgi:adenylyltransferase/sulfurtransferase
MNSISITELEQWKQSEKDFVLIDVREDFEHEYFNIGGLNIPLGLISNSLSQIPMDKDIVLYCAKGIRSVIALQKLERKGYHLLYNLSGGLAAAQ